MIDFRQQIKKHERKLLEYGRDTHNEYVQLAREFGEAPETIQNEAREEGGIWKDYELVCKTQQEIQTIADSIAELEDLEAQLKNKKQGLAENKAEVKNLHAELKRMYRITGEKLFELYTNAPQHYAVYSDHFAELERVYREKFKLDSEAETVNRNIFSNVLQQGRKILRSGRIHKLEAHAQDLCSKIAQQLHSHWLKAENSRFNVWEDSSVQAVLSPLIVHSENIAENEESRSRLKEEIANIQSRKTELSQKKTPEQFVRQLQAQHAQLEERLSAQLATLGSALRKAGVPLELVKAHAGTIEELQDKHNATSEMLRRLRAAQRIASLQEEESRLQSRQAKITAQITALSAQKQEIQNAHEKLQKEIAEQKRVQGDFEELMAQL